MKARPETPLIIVPSQKLFGLLVKLINLKAPMGVFDHLPQGCGLWEVGEVILPVAVLSSGRTLANEPTQVFALPFQATIGAQGDEFLA